MSKVDELDKKVETTMLSPHEVDLRRCLKARLIQLLHEEEIKWHQRSKTNQLLYGDSNTKYFHLVANGKHKKTRILQLEDEGQIIRGDDHLKKYITDYYHGLFGQVGEDYLSLDESLNSYIQQVSQEENEFFGKRR
jgi:hypothetical protein